MEKNMEDIIKKASLILKEGGLVGVPTETVYGLAANALDEKAVKKIFQVKNRPFIDPLIVHIFSLADLDKIAYTNDFVKPLAEAFWPGALTLVLKKKSIVPSLVSAGLDTVAIRMPSHKVMRALLEYCRLPLSAPSANPFTYISPTTALHVKENLGDKIDLIIDGGACQFGVESTILDITREIPRVLRFGPISPEQIEKVLGIAKVLLPEKKPAIMNAPGMLERHYAPKTSLSLFDKASDIDISNLPKDEAVIFLARQKNISKENIFFLSEDEDLFEISKNLFSLLRKLDKLSFKKIYCQRPPNESIGLALNDRLKRAAKKLS